MIVVKDVAVHLVLNDYRHELDLEHRWLNPPPEEMTDAFHIYEKAGK